MEKKRRISALVAAPTRELLERHARASGVKKDHLVEQALQRYLVALEQLLPYVLVHPKLVVRRKSGEAILKATQTGKPTKALRELMR
jgi:hypothetical protein